MHRFKFTGRALSLFKTNTSSYVNRRGMGEAFSSKEEQMKNRRKYAVFGSVIMMYFGSHAVLLWRRRSEYRAMNKELPPIGFDEFQEKYLSTGKIKSLVLHPNFQVCDAYIDDETPKNKSQTLEQKVNDVRASMLQNKTIFGQKFFQKPNVRFVFKDGVEALEQKVIDAQKQFDQPTEIHLEVNSFPSYRELAFITGSVLFGACCVGLMKI